MPPLVDTLPADWVYICEGGATIVLSYHGPSNPFFDGTVLRLRKRALDDTDTDTVHDSEQEDPIIEFQEKCLERLISPTHLPRMKRVLVGADSEKWLQALAVQCEPLRPLERRQKDEIDRKRLKAVLATDLVGGEGITVEIKARCRACFYSSPKWGFLPSPIYLSNATRPIKTQTCRFCMHSHLKALSSSYCPLDLFSGDESRTKKALNSLWDAWADRHGTVNNFRVFVNGKNISPTEQQCIVGLLSDIADPKEAVISALLPVLLDAPVLHTISRLQRTLDALDIEGLARLCGLAPIGTQPTIAEWTDFLDAYLASPTTPPPADATHLRYHVLAYLLSATFKDCSVLVRVPNGTATVIDLDPKSVDRLRKWEQLDREIVTAYAAVPNRKICVDS
ncbi:inositol-pentakisphosphate 2-kinase [Mycena alexandri]|uniref:Inositol-pentakisphosphate 2-kinase n=1 Tax=Mycena alexandri TaxID=1745969 RepID=A0AAD6WT20_9AGAR|nr:inositol-pentakisphosphate 2-kinase [Mycena alexandri]